MRSRKRASRIESKDEPWRSLARHKKDDQENAQMGSKRVADHGDGEIYCRTKRGPVNDKISSSSMHRIAAGEQEEWRSSLMLTTTGQRGCARTSVTHLEKKLYNKTGLTALRHTDYTIGWICALPKEQTAAIAMLDQKHPPLSTGHHDRNTYTLGSIGNHNIVIACLPFGQTGNSSSATVAARMIATFTSIKFGVLVGIGGGIPPKVRLGDIVVSAPKDGLSGVIQWDMGKAEEGGNFKRTGSLNNPPSILLTALSVLRSEHEMNGSKISQYLDQLRKNWPRLASKYLKSDLLEDVLFKPDYVHINTTEEDILTDSNGEGDDEGDSCHFCDKTRIIKRKQRPMEIHYGLIASGNQVIKNAMFRDKVNENLGGKVLCVEMEAAGLMNDLPCIVIRGICDYADSHKNKTWQEHAAAVAAAFAKELLSVVPEQAVAEMLAVKGMCDQLNGMSSGIQEMLSRQHAQECQAVLDWLIPDDYSSQQSDHINRRQLGTGQWLLESTKFKTWLHNKSQTLFCPGLPGAGKTIIASTVIDHLFAKAREHENFGVAFIYFNYRRQHEQNLYYILASLLRQLIQRRASIPDNVQALYENHKKHRTRLTVQEVLEALHLVGSLYSRLFIVVDALDEYQLTGGHRNRFLAEMSLIQTKCGANLFITSRLTPSVMNTFEHNDTLEIQASNEDVSRYLDSRMVELPGFVGRDPGLQEEIKAGLIKSADGIFLLAQLLMTSLDDKTTVKAVESALQRFQTRTSANDDEGKKFVLSQTYGDVMKRITEQKTGFRRLAESALKWVTCSNRPLTTLELRHALAIEPDTTDLDKKNLPEIEDIVNACAGLVTIDQQNDIIRLVHYTTQEYFEHTQQQWFPTAKEELTISCITYLSFDSFRTGPCLIPSAFKNRLAQYPLYDYAARNWGYHALDASAKTVELVLGFFQSKPRLSAATQAMEAFNRGYWFAKYAQEAPDNVTSAHVAAFFGLAYMMQPLENVCDLDARDSCDMTPLCVAAEQGHTSVVNILLSKRSIAPAGVDSLYQQRPLELALMKMHHAVVQLLLADDRTEPDYGDGMNRTPLSRQAEKGHEKMVQLLLASKRVVADSRDHYGRTPLSYAALNGHENIVKLLLATNRVDPDSRDRGSRTPLSFAALNGHDNVVKLLLATNRVDPDSRDCEDRTPLWYSLRDGNEKTVRLLLATNRVDPDYRDNYGRSPFWYACERGHEWLVKLLLASDKVDVNRMEFDGRTPFWCACVRSHERVVQIMLASGRVDLRLQDREGRTALWFALGADNKRIIDMLLTFGAELEWRDNQGQTILSQTASYYGTGSMVEALIQRGADIESTDQKGLTPLFHAVQSANLDCTKVILSHGASLEPRDKNGRTPLLWTVQEIEKPNNSLSFTVRTRRLQIISLLLDHGADKEAEDNHGATALWFFQWQAWFQASFRVSPVEKDADSSTSCGSVQNDRVSDVCQSDQDDDECKAFLSSLPPVTSDDKTDFISLEQRLPLSLNRENDGRVNSGDKCHDAACRKDSISLFGRED